jgi:hypothetical protein
MDFLKSLVPMLGTALGGPFGGVAASFIAEKLGLQGKTIDAVKQALSEGNMTADQVSQLRLAEIDFNKFMADNEIKKEQLALDNTKDARAMQVATRSWVPATLAITLTGGYLLILVMMMLGVLKVSDNQSLLILLGGLATGFGSVLNYYFGSSHSSAQKTELLANSTPAT